MGDKAFEVVKCLELLATLLGWRWTNDILIREHLWSILREWKTKILCGVDSETRDLSSSQTQLDNTNLQVENTKGIVGIEDSAGLTQEDQNSDGQMTLREIPEDNGIVAKSETALQECEPTSKCDNMEALIVSVIRLFGEYK